MENASEHRHIPHLVVFDLDDTLAASKMPPDQEIAELLRALLRLTRVAVISGAHLQRFEEQFLPTLSASDEELNNLILAPTCGAALFAYEDGWKPRYKHSLTQEEKDMIVRTFEEHVFGKVYEVPDELFGDILEDRDSMLSFAGLGQKAPIHLKVQWDPDQGKRIEIRRVVLPHLGEDFEVRIGGSTSIDITRKGIDKGYGVEKLSEHFGIGKERIVFVGDALFEGGNDFPVVATGVEVRSVKHPEHTKEVIREFLATERCPEC